MPETVASLAALVGGKVLGDGGRPIHGVNDLRLAGPEEIGFVRDIAYADLARDSAAGAVLVPEDLKLSQPQILIDPVDPAFARIAAQLHPAPHAEEQRHHPSALVAEGARVGEPTHLGPNVVVDAGASIGSGSMLGAGVVVGKGCRIGKDCILHPRVVLYPGTVLGDRVQVHSGAVIGSDGFGYAHEGARWLKVPQVGRVRVEDDVEIGANCTVDRATLGETRIGAGSKIDNLVHIGHNCVLGRDNAVAGMSALSGSTTLGDRVHLAGHVVSAGHLRVVDDVRVGGNSVLRGDVDQAGDYMGYPLLSKRRWGRVLLKLARMAEGVRSRRADRGETSAD